MRSMGAEKPWCWCFASVFVPISDENRDGGRSFYGTYALKSRLRFAVSGLHSPPRWRNAQAPMRYPCTLSTKPRRWGPRYPPQDEGNFGNLTGSVHFNRAYGTIRFNLLAELFLRDLGSDAQISRSCGTF